MSAASPQRRYALATGRDQFTKHWTQEDPLTWGGLLQWLDLDHPASRKDCGGFVLGELQATPDLPHPDCKVQPCHGLHRMKGAVVSRSAVALDADSASRSFVADSAADLGSAAAFYTTWSHTADKPRWRLLAPLSRDVTPSEYRLIAQALVLELGVEQFDTGSSQPERLMHRPSKQSSAYAHHVVPGEPLEADAWLARAKELGLEDAPTLEPFLDDSPRRDPALGVHPYAAAAVRDELAKLDALPHPWFEGAHWDQGVFDVACNLVEFGNSSWSGYTHEQALWDVLDHAPTDEVWTGKHNHAKWLSALNKVNGGARPLPKDERGTPEDDFDRLPAEGPSGLPAAFQRLSISDLLSPDRPAREYVVEPLIATGTAVALVAPAGSRKSLILLRVAVAVARGEDDFAGMEIPRARRVLYVDMENTEDDLRERLESFGVTQTEPLDNLILVSLPPMLPLDSAKGGQEFLAAVDAFGLGPGDLVCLDSYQRVTEAGENDSDTTRGYYRHTGVHLKGRGLTVVRTDNTGKDVSRGARGSSGKRDDVDVEYLLKPDGDYVEVSVGKARHRGVTETSIHVIQKDGHTLFRSDASPAKTEAQRCVAAMDALALSDRTGYRKAGEVLEGEGHMFARNVVREACRQRQSRSARAAQDFGQSSG